MLFGLACAACLALSLSASRAHESYPVRCCNGNAQGGDCKPVACESIVEKSDGYEYSGFHFRASQVFPSFNAECHACIYQGVVPTCLFIQSTT